MQSYYTKACLVDYLAGYINNTISENSIILDPAAGIGNLTDRILVPKGNIYLVEPDKKSVDFLNEKGYKHGFNLTFEEFLRQRSFPNFTHVIMNPPFKNRLDLFFFNKCFELLQEHGKIAAITSENSIYEELYSLGYTFNIDFPNSHKVNNFDELSSLLQEYIDNLHNTNSFDNTNARAYYLLAEKIKLLYLFFRALHMTDTRTFQVLKI